MTNHEHESSVTDRLRERYIDGALAAKAGPQTRQKAGEEFDEWLRQQRIAVWEEARGAIGMLPCWYKDENHHGFDFGDDENGLAVETGARLYVMQILNHNPYREGSTFFEHRHAHRSPRGRPRNRSTQGAS